jgi:hypothetical protein
MRELTIEHPCKSWNELTVPRDSNDRSCDDFGACVIIDERRRLAFDSLMSS